MSFISDKQTTEELNLLGKYQPVSVYSLFNKVSTKGGERLLETMLRSPLQETKSINDRVSIFQYFQDAGYTFPLDEKVVSQFVAWLDTGSSSSSVGATLASAKKKLLSTLVHDERYAEQITGLLAAAQTLSRLHTFISSIKSSGSLYDARIQQIKKILSDSKLMRFQLLAKTEKPSLKETASYDYLLKKALGKEMEEIVNFISELDVYIAVSAVAKERKFTYATARANTANELKVKGLRHPALNGAVGNDLTLDANHNLLFLTGANMAGKSTLMKSIGIALYLAHTGFPVAADEMSFSVKDGLYSSINVPDNINQGYSHFYAEVLRVKQAAELVSNKKNMLVMFDELFKGTNVKDAYEGTLEVTKSFCRYKNCLFVISTHIIEVGEALEHNPNIKFGYMPTVMDGAKPRYTYHLSEGITEDRQGMLIIQNEGIVDMLQ